MKFLYLLLPLLFTSALAGPSEQADAVLNQARIAVALRSAQVALQATMAAAASPSIPPPVASAAAAFNPPAPVTAAPSGPVAAVAEPPLARVTVVTVPSEIKDAVVTLASALITGMIGIALAWMRLHLKFMKDVGMNQQITASAQEFGGLLVQRIKERGVLPSTLNVHTPEVAAFVQTVMSNYPEYATAIGMTPDKVAGIIVKAAANVIAPAEVSAEVVAEVAAVTPAAAITQVTNPENAIPVSVIGTPMIPPTWETTKGA